MPSRSLHSSQGARAFSRFGSEYDVASLRCAAGSLGASTAGSLGAPDIRRAKNAPSEAGIKSRVLGRFSISTKQSRKVGPLTAASTALHLAKLLPKSETRYELSAKSEKCSAVRCVANKRATAASNSCSASQSRQYSTPVESPYAASNISCSDHRSATGARSVSPSLVSPGSGANELRMMLKTAQRRRSAFSDGAAFACLSPSRSESFSVMMPTRGC